MKAKELLGKRVEWLESVDAERGQALLRRGVVTDAQGKNIEIGGDWLFIDNLIELRVIDERTNGDTQ